MSIRLRLTILYSTIVALTLILFSAVLYVSQAQKTLSIIKSDLAQRGGRASFAWNSAHETLGWGGAQPWMAPPDRPEFDQARQALQPVVQEARTRDALRLLDGNGIPLDIGVNETTEDLPISQKGLTRLQSGAPWTEIVAGQTERWYVYNEPVFVEGQTIGIIQMARSLADRDRGLRALGIALGLGVVLTTMIASAAGWALAGVTLRPIHRITQAAHEIGQTQSFSSRVQHAGPNDELGQLATTFNEMLSQLEGSYRQVTHALQAQRDFVADVSHELRTPLTTIRGNLDLLRRHPPLPGGEQVEIMTDLADETERLSRMVRDLLVLARADAGQELPIATLNVTTIACDVCRQAQVLAPERTLRCDGAAELRAAANEDALRQSILILLDNSIKYSEGLIAITTEDAGSEVLVRVTDRGPGMSAELQARIFDRFYRGDVSRSTPGYGLGLSIARALMEAQHGRIDIESRIGEGSTFTLALPKSPDAPPA